MSMHVKTQLVKGRSLLQNLLLHSKLKTGPLAWSIIVCIVILFFIPFAIPGETAATLGGYDALSLLPVLIAVLLRARVGALVACFLLTGGTGLYNCIIFGFKWPSAEVDGWLIGNISLLIFGLVAGQIRSMSNKLVIAHQKLAVAHEAIQKQALTDPLTDLPNHRAMIEQLDKELERTRRSHRAFSVIFFDGDRFKKVNDTYGHVVGDLVLCELGKRVSNVLRGGDTLGRFGGEEFVVLLPETDAIQAEDIAERIRATIASFPLVPTAVDGGINITISVGIATYPGDGETINALLDMADQAMYWAKRLGRNQIRTAAEACRANHRAIFDILTMPDEERDATLADGLHTDRLQRAYYLGTIYSLMRMIEVRDAGMSRHSHAVSDLATAIALHLGIEPKSILSIGTAALLHDIGKIAIPDALLHKVGPLSPTERSLVQQHPELGMQILEISPFLQELIPAIRHHHERWDGTGYPDQLSGEHIPLEARIIGVAEAYDAMLADRAYQVGRSPGEALAELQRCAGTQFDPKIVQAFTIVLANQHEQTAEGVVSQLEEISERSVMPESVDTFPVRL
ncbi:MAG TPA: diguanylate cyclase [Ktedonobacteraceae bacterium]|nr:diguanylate cyclase [Ktedonobacteraceae bacterium]